MSYLLSVPGLDEVFIGETVMDELKIDIEVQKELHSRIEIH